MSLRHELREFICRGRMIKMRERLENEDVTIFSSNCVGGGVIYHALGMRFMSPTVNLFMSPTDFIMFCTDPSHYLSEELREIKNGDKPYPCGVLDGLRINFVHYADFKEAKTKWLQRSERVNLSNCCAIMVDRDGCTDADALAFDRLHISCKALLTSRVHEGVQCEVMRKSWADGNQGATRDLCAFKGPLSTFRWIDEFDYVAFLNNAGGVHD